MFIVEGGGKTMAQPIAPTPVLRGKEAIEFISTIHKDAGSPAYLIPTPKLEKARKLINRYANHREKRIR